jgi:glucosamine 6-phosphate synthetase-like amidotransferase/phosphosugar isomerase protein
MCGIVAYIGNKNCKNILVNGLKRLEYRGYDSAGIGILVKSCNKNAASESPEEEPGKRQA